MNQAEFMKLPLESRKKIELAILDLDKAVKAHHGISMLKKKPKLKSAHPADLLDTREASDGKS
jgi:hypothetical protein